MMQSIVRAVLVLLAAAVLFVNLPVWLSPHLLEQGDLAANALQVERAREFHELLGPYSQHGFHHLGPISFYFFGAAQTVFAFLPSVLARHMLAQFFLNLLCLAGVLKVLRKSGLAPPLVAAGGFLLAAPLVWLGGGDLLMLGNVWGPLIVALPVLLCGLATVRLVQGDLTWLPAGVLAAIVSLHNHLPTSAVVGSVVVAAGILLVIRRDRIAWTPSGMRRRIILAASVGLVTLASLPGLVEQVKTNPGNLTLLYRFFSKNGADIHPWPEVIDKLGQAVTDPWVVLGAWTGIGFHSPVTIASVLVILLFASVLQYRRSPESWRLIILMAWVMLAVTVASARTVPGNLHTYLYYYLYPLVGLLHLVLWKEFYDRWIEPHLDQAGKGRAVSGVILVGALFFLTWGFIHRSEPPVPDDRYAEIVAHFGLEDIERIHLFLDKKVENDQVWDVLPTLALRFRRDGVKVTVPDSYVFLCGEEMRPEFDIHQLTLAITQRRPAGPDERFLDGERWGVFLLTPTEWNPAAFLEDLPWRE